MKELLALVFFGTNKHLLKIIVYLVLCAIIVQTTNATPVRVRLSGKHKILHSEKYREHYYPDHQFMLKHRKASHTSSHHPHLLHYRAASFNCADTFTESKALYEHLKTTEKIFTNGMYGVGPHNLTRLANQTIENFTQAIEKYNISPERSNDLSTTLRKLHHVLKILNSKREKMERNPNQGYNHSPDAYGSFMNSVNVFTNFLRTGGFNEIQEPADEAAFKYLDETNSQKEYIFFQSYMELVGLLSKVLHNNCDSVKSLS